MDTLPASFHWPKVHPRTSDFLEFRILSRAIWSRMHLILSLHQLRRRARHNEMTVRDCSRIRGIRSVAEARAGVTAGDWQGQELQGEVESGI